MSDIKAITPLIKKVKGGTFITFQSAGEDMSFTFDNPNKEFVFSHFALLDIPDIETPANGENLIQFDAIEGAFTNGLSTASPPPEGDRLDLSESLQNYLLNMETLLIRDNDYNPDLKQHTAERLFFKWLKEIGAIRFRDASSLEKTPSLAEDRFVEQDDNDTPSTGNLYESVVKYIGEVDIEGSHRDNTNAFKEVYIYVPTQNGDTPTVLFKSEEDENYFPGMTIKQTGQEDIEWIQGRDATDSPTQAGLRAHAIYDMDVPLGSYDYDVNAQTTVDIQDVNLSLNAFIVSGDFEDDLPSGKQFDVQNSTGNDGTYIVDVSSYDAGTDTTTIIPEETIQSGVADGEISFSTDDLWFADLAANGPNAYFTDPVFGLSDDDEITRTDPNTSKSVSWIRNKLDGIMIDFDKSSYTDFEDDPTLKAFNQYNNSDESESFEFNAILLYYDVYDPNNPEDRATNLFGVLLLNDLVTISAGGAKIEELSKIRPNDLINQQGNGYGQKLNFKFDVSADNVQPEIEVSVNDYNTFSMQLFSETMQRIALANDNFEEVILKNKELQDRIAELESLILNDENKELLLSQIESINEKLQSVQDTDNLLELINQNKSLIDQILEGETTVDLDIALNTRSFDGLRLRKVGDTLFFRNERQEYDTVGKIDLVVSPQNLTSVRNEMKLGNHTTLYYHESDLVKEVNNNIDIYIDDSREGGWKQNQAFRLVFSTEINMNGFGFAFYTDKPNRFNNSDPYKQLIGVIPEVTTLKPIEIVCVDTENYKFIITQG